MMDQGGLTQEDYARFMEEAAGNVAADGMFSIQVSSRAAAAVAAAVQQRQQQQDKRGLQYRPVCSWCLLLYLH